MRCLQAIVFAGGLAAMGTGALALEPLPRLSDSELISICRAKRETATKCDCYIRTMKTALPADDVNVIFWIMWTDPARGKAYAKAKAKEQPQWARSFAQRGGSAMSKMDATCQNVF